MFLFSVLSLFSIYFINFHVQSFVSKPIYYTRVSLYPLTEKYINQEMTGIIISRKRMITSKKMINMSSLEKIVSLQLLYTTITNSIKENLFNDDFVFYLTDNIGKNVGVVENVIFYYIAMLYYLFSNLPKTENISTKLNKLEKDKYKNTIKSINKILFIMMFIFTKNIENAL